MDESAIERVLDAVGRELAPKDINIKALVKAINSAILRYHVAGELGRDAHWKERNKYREQILRAAKKLSDLLKGENSAWVLDRHELAPNPPPEGKPLLPSAESVRCLLEKDGSSVKRLKKDLATLHGGLSAGLKLAEQKADWREEERLAKTANRASAEPEAAALGDDKLDQRYVRHGTPVPVFKSEHSGFERLAGEYLAAVYCEHFKREPSHTLSRAGDGGPYIRFVRTILEIEGVRKGEKAYTAQSIAAALRKAKSTSR